MPDPAGAGATILGLKPMWVATALLVATYALIVSERVNRAVVALLFACLTVVLGIATQDEAVQGIDFNTIGLLVGMMVIVSISKRTGMFEYLAIWATKKVRAEPAGILFALQLVTAVVSAFLDNVTTVLLVVPVTFVICEHLKVEPYAFLVAQVFASNIGGTATLIGDPPNILIGSRVGLSFNDFVFNLAPVIVVVQAVTALLFHLFYGRHFVVAAEAKARVMAFDERKAILDRVLLVKCLVVLSAVVVAFVLARRLHLEPATIAISGAAVLMLLLVLGKPADEQTRLTAKTFEETEWVTIFFFVGLFIVIHGVERTGLLALLARQLVEATGGNLVWTGIAILWASAVLSSIIDNIPFVATMIPLIKAMAPSFGGPDGLMPLWWALSLGACLGGNGTVIGASANLTVSGLAERAGHRFSFVDYLKVAYPVMLASIAICNVYLLVRYF